MVKTILLLLDIAEDLQLGHLVDVKNTRAKMFLRSAIHGYAHRRISGSFNRAEMQRLTILDILLILQ